MMTGLPAYPYSLMSYPYSPYLQLPVLTQGQAGQPGLATNISCSVPGYPANNMAYCAQTMANLGTNSILTQSYGQLGTPSLAVQGTNKVESVPSVPSRVSDVPPAPLEVEVPGDKDEYIQELIQERDNIENSSVSNLSKSHVLRLLNQGTNSEERRVMMKQRNKPGRPFLPSILVCS